MSDNQLRLSDLELGAAAVIDKICLTPAAKRIQPLPGFGYHGVAVKVTRKQVLTLPSKGLRSQQLRFPAPNAAVEWPEIQLIKKIA